MKLQEVKRVLSGGYTVSYLNVCYHIEEVILLYNEDFYYLLKLRDKYTSILAPLEDVEIADERYKPLPPPPQISEVEKLKKKLEIVESDNDILYKKIEYYQKLLDA